MNTTDKETIMNITREMALAQSADEIMKHWAQDVDWFDITAHHLKGYDAVHAEFSEQFGKLSCCGAEITDIDCKMCGDLGIVTTTQDFWAIFKANNERIEMKTRQTDCYEKRDGEWLLSHQHVSLCLSEATML